MPTPDTTGDATDNTPTMRPGRPGGKRWHSEKQIPATRAEADATYGPARSAGVPRANGFRLRKADDLGLLRVSSERGPSLDVFDVHEAILDATYGPKTPSHTMP